MNNNKKCNTGLTTSQLAILAAFVVVIGDLIALIAAIKAEQEGNNLSLGETLLI